MDIQELIKKYVDIKGLVKEVIGEFVIPKLRAYASKTGNKIDDGIVEALAKFLLADDTEGELNMTKKKESDDKEVKGSEADQAAEKAGIKLNKDPEKDLPAQLHESEHNANDGQGVQSVSKAVKP